MANYYPIVTTYVKIPRVQLDELQNIYRKNHQGSDYKGRNDFPKYLYENGLVNFTDKKCSQTLEEIRQSNIPDGTPASQVELKYPSERFEDGGRGRGDNGQFV